MISTIELPGNAFGFGHPERDVCERASRGPASRRLASELAGGKAAAAVATTGIIRRGNRPRQGSQRLRSLQDRILPAVYRWCRPLRAQPPANSLTSLRLVVDRPTFTGASERMNITRPSVARSDLPRIAARWFPTRKELKQIASPRRSILVQPLQGWALSRVPGVSARDFVPRANPGLSDCNAVGVATAPTINLRIDRH